MRLNSQQVTSVQGIDVTGATAMLQEPTKVAQEYTKTLTSYSVKQFFEEYSISVISSTIMEKEVITLNSSFKVLYFELQSENGKVIQVSISKKVAHKYRVGQEISFSDFFKGQVIGVQKQVRIGTENNFVEDAYYSYYMYPNTGFVSTSIKDGVQVTRNLLDLLE